ncbi:hypothetical protein EON65_35565 [archaeon]|nr:MAG: hypothetical protein EON65_35565 [archaeon]
MRYYWTFPPYVPRAGSCAGSHAESRTGSEAGSDAGSVRDASLRVVAGKVQTRSAPFPPVHEDQEYVDDLFENDEDTGGDNIYVDTGVFVVQIDIEF